MGQALALKVVYTLKVFWAESCSTVNTIIYDHIMII